MYCEFDTTRRSYRENSVDVVPVGAAVVAPENPLIHDRSEKAMAIIWVSDEVGCIPDEWAICIQVVAWLKSDPAIHAPHHSPTERAIIRRG
jgi:hypothetical protein